MGTCRMIGRFGGVVLKESNYDRGLGQQPNQFPNGDPLANSIDAPQEPYADSTSRAGDMRAAGRCKGATYAKQ